MMMLPSVLVFVAVATTTPQTTMTTAAAAAIANKHPPAPATPTPSAKCSFLRSRPSPPSSQSPRRRMPTGRRRDAGGGGGGAAMGIAIAGFAPSFRLRPRPPHPWGKSPTGELLPAGTSRSVRVSHGDGDGDGDGDEILGSRPLERPEGRERPGRGQRIGGANADGGTGRRRRRGRTTATDGPPTPVAPRRRRPTVDRRDALLLAGAVLVVAVASRGEPAAAAGPTGGGADGDDGDDAATTLSSSEEEEEESLRSHASDVAGGEATMMASPLLSSPPKDVGAPATPQVAPVAKTAPAATTVGVDPRYFVAGGSCASISHGLATPFDVVKTRIQSDPDEFRDLGLLDSARRISESSSDGPMALLGGLGPTVVGYGIEGAVKFGVYEALKPVAMSLVYGAVVGGDVGGESTWVPYLLASVAAGAAASVLLCPLEDARIKMVTDPEDYAEGGTLGAVSRMISEDGPLAAFSGMPAMLAKQVPYTMTKQVSFEFFAGLLYGAAAAVAPSLSMVASDLKWEVSVCAAFSASILACVASQPGDVLLTQTYKGSHEEGGGVSSGSSIDVSDDDGAGGVGGAIGEGLSTGTAMAVTATATAAKKEEEGGRDFATLASSIYESEGIGGFFAGLGPRFVHVASIITSQLVIYDLLKQLLGLPATGTH